MLLGLQRMWTNLGTGREFFAVMDRHFRPEVSRTVGRPDIDFWRLVVLAVVKQALGYDYDHLVELANEHGGLRETLSHGARGFDDKKYRPRTLAYNFGHLIPGIACRAERRGGEGRSRCGGEFGRRAAACVVRLVHGRDRCANSDRCESSLGRGPERGAQCGDGERETRFGGMA